MITKQFKALVALLLQANSDNQNGIFQCKDTLGNTIYLTSYWSTSHYPGNNYQNVRFSNGLVGIVVGSGSTPSSENDYSLESMIKSGLSATTPTLESSIDNNGNVVLSATFSLTNTSDSPITVSEIGYVCKHPGAIAYNQANTGDKSILLDRTVLESPVVIGAGNSATIRYDRKTVIT